MRLLVYDMLVNVNGIYYAHVCEQVRQARSAGNSAIENLCIIIIINLHCWNIHLHCYSSFNTADQERGENVMSNSDTTSE